MAALMRTVDWAQTALGPVEAWPQSLRTVVRIMLTSRYAMWMGWGDQLSFFYNDAYRPTLGVKHPWALGQPAQSVWAEIWAVIGPRIETVMQTGEATWDEALRLFLERSGYPEETYHTFSYSPLTNDVDMTDGMLCVVTEVTERVLGERRLTLLREVAASLATTQTRREVFAALQGDLNTEAHDVPFTLTYLFNKEDGNAYLACTTGISEDHAAAPYLLDAQDPTLIWPLQPFLAASEPLVVENLTTLFPDLPTGPWDRPPEQALVVGLPHQGQEALAGFLIVGLNPYRRLDAEYVGFVTLLAGQLASSLANARAYEDERKRAEALAELDRAKTTFFSNVSHEFRTPLTLMLGPMEDALNSETGALDGKNLKVVHRNGLRLLKLVNALLDFSRLEAGRVRAQYELTDVGSFTAELASVFRSAVEKAGMRLIVRCPELSLPVYIDRDMWEKIVLNLLSNAFKFTAEGEIEVSLAAEGETVVLVVRDTGTGISEDQLPQIFERFHRVEGARSRTHEGTGIGLALVKELVNLHGGEITVRSRLGEGTQFTIKLPSGIAHLPAESIIRSRTPTSHPASANLFIEEALRWIPELAPTTSPEEVGQKTEGGLTSVRSRRHEDWISREWKRDSSGEALPVVVLADDNADMREYVQRLLSPEYNVIAVADGDALLAAIHQVKPDLILSDVMMPGRDGFSMLKILRDDPNTRSIPVILLSARAGTEARIEGLSAGADDYITKPFSAKELLARVSALLELSKVRKMAEQSVQESMERLGAALAAADTGTFRWDFHSNELQWDENLDRLFGLPPGKTVRSLASFLAQVHPEDQAEVIARCERCRDSGADFEMEMRVLTPDGSERWIFDKGKTFSDDKGRPLYMTGACLDITARKRADATLQERTRLAELGVEIGNAITAKETLSGILQRCAEILVSHLEGALGRIWTYNEMTHTLELQASVGLYTHLDGPHSRVPIGRFKIGLIAEERKPHLTNAVIGDPRVGDQEWAKREGMVAFAGYPLIVEEKLVGVVALFAKHTLTPTTLDAMAAVSNQIALGIERKRAETEVQSLNVRLQRAMTETHHRVKNNLQLISALIDMQRGDHPETVPVSEFVRLSANVRALGVIHDILTDEAKAGSEQETLSAKAVLDKLLGILQQTAGAHRLQFVVEEVRLLGRQATSLSLVTNELVSNAQKHGKNETFVTFRLAEGFAVLQVEDDGPGFPEGFDPILSSNTGLELVENMVQWDLRGKAVYDSRPEGGGRVQVIFPVACP